MNGTDGGQFEKPSTQALTSSAGPWNRHAPIFWNPIELQRSPALAVHNGKLWLLYVGGSLELGYGIGDNDSFTLMPAFSANGTQSSTGPALIDLAGTLHCVFAEMDGTLVHYQYNDVDQIWGNRAVVYQGQTSTDAALTVIDQNRLLCVFVPNGHDVYSSVWDAKDGWGLVALVNGEMTYGCPATYTLDANGTPQVFCVLPSDNANRDLLSLTYNSSSNTWFGAPSNPPEATDFGVKGSSFNGEAFISFQERDGQGEALVISYQSGNWSPHEYIGELADDTPTVCAYNGVLNVMLNSKNTKSLIWCQKSILNTNLTS